MVGCRDRCKRLNGPRERYEQMLQRTDAFELYTPAEVILYKDSTVQSQLEIFAQPEVYHVLESEVIDSTCFIQMDACFRDQQAILINATFRSLNKIYFESAGEIRSGELIEQDTIRIENTGLGDIDMALKSDQIISHITSSGNIILSGTAHRSVSLAASSGEIEAMNLIADTAIVHTVGSGIISVHADHRLEVHFYKPTTVRYRGNPSVIEVYGEGNLVDANL